MTDRMMDEKTLDDKLTLSDMTETATEPSLHFTFFTRLRERRNRLIEKLTPRWPSWIPNPLPETIRKNWYLGFTSFGGPPVHFQMMHKKFVEKEGWLDEQLFQEIFALSQALPGSASTKMLFCINFVRSGFVASLGSFLLWSLPGALGMYGLSLGVSEIGNTLPEPVYALLSGLNSATVGIIALAAMQLAMMAVTDKLTRALVFLTGAAGMCYTALWFYPVLMMASGLSTIIWDYRWPHRLILLVLCQKRKPSKSSRRKRKSALRLQREIELNGVRSLDDDDLQRFIWSRRVYMGDVEAAISQSPQEASSSGSSTTLPAIELNVISWKLGTAIIAAFAMSFITVMVLRTFIKDSSRGLHLFQNLYLAGTIIFGGGPVVIPLLREYIVAENWVSQRDFLLGLALIQAFPGPNFNFAIYLGSLATAGTSLPSFGGALIAFVGMYLPGVMVVTGVMGLWKVLRSKRWLLSFLRGINAGAVGLVFTAVYKLWQIGRVDINHQSGSPLGGDPWWVTITATSFVGGCWFGLQAPYAILLGGSMGLAWYGVQAARSGPDFMSVGI